MARPYIIKIAAVKNQAQQFVGILRYSREAGKVILLKQFTNIELTSFSGTKELNEFLNNGGNDQWRVVKVDKPKAYYTPFVTLVARDGKFYCQASIFASYEDAKDRKGEATLFRGPESMTMEGATKSFWHMWNHGQMDFRTEEGAAARLTRLEPNYKHMTLEVDE